MDADRKARRPVIGQHPLPDGRLWQLGSCGRGIERQRKLLLLPARAGDRLRAREAPQLPEELPAREAKAVASAGNDQGLEPVVRELRPLGELADAREGAAALAFLHDRLCVVFADAVHVVDADAHGAVLDGALGRTDVPLRSTRLDGAALTVTH